MKKLRCVLRTFIACVLAAAAPLAATADYYAARNGANSDQPPYTSWATAASNIQDAVNAATNAATVWVGAGTYTLPPNATNYPELTPNVVYINKPLVLRSSNGVPATTIIDGDGLNRGVAWTYGNGGSAPFVLDGFTISNCFATNNGGGILIAGGSRTSVVQNCMISDNTVTNTATRNDGGGGIFTYSTIYYVISNCTFRGNTVYQNQLTGGGGGAYLQNSSSGRKGVVGRIDKCLFEDNAVYEGCGGGLCFYFYGIHEIRNTVIRGNRQFHSAGSAERGGGGLEHSYNAGVRMWNCLVYNNRAQGPGGGIYNMKGGNAGNALELYNCTIVSNASQESATGGGIDCRTSPTDRVLMYNTIVASNRPGSIYVTTRDVKCFSSSGFTNCCITSTNVGFGNILYIGTANITNSPAFVDFAGTDFHLTTDSPCLNSGTNQAWWMAGAVDLDDHRRIDATFNRVDMGCYEYVYQGSMITIQ